MSSALQAARSVTAQACCQAVRMHPSPTCITAKDRCSTTCSIIHSGAAPGTDVGSRASTISQTGHAQPGCCMPIALHLPRRQDEVLEGFFSWRPGMGPPAGPTGTVLAGGGANRAGAGETFPARGPWAKTGMVRARLEGLAFPQPPRTSRAGRPTPEVGACSAYPSLLPACFALFVAAALQRKRGLHASLQQAHRAWLSFQLS